MKLHPNSLTIPRSELANFVGSVVLANEIAAALVPVRKQTSCTVYDRQEVMAYYNAKVLPQRTAKRD
jgi:hypothetical protein